MTWSLNCLPMQLEYVNEWDTEYRYVGTASNTLHSIFPKNGFYSSFSWKYGKIYNRSQWVFSNMHMHYALYTYYNIVKEQEHSGTETTQNRKPKAKTEAFDFYHLVHSLLNITTMHLLIYIQSTEHWTVVKLFE